ncbi:MAG: Spy/CpxP family protein refolding chaperone [Pseudomonadota bacterium]
MSRKNLTLVTLLAFLTVFAAGLVVWAADGPLAPGFRTARIGRGIFGGEQKEVWRKFKWGRLKNFIELRENLNLTEEQKERLKKLRREYFGPLAVKLLAKKQALSKEVAADNPDEKAIRLASEDLGRTIGDAAVTAAAFIKEARAVLTPEQIERLKAFRESNLKALDQLLKQLGESKP